MAATGAKNQEAPAEAPRLLSRPLEALVFLLPLILFYEIGCLVAYHAASGPDHAFSSTGQERVVASHILRLFFELFGSTGIWMPGLAVVVILLCTHLVSGRPWTIRKRAVGLMYAESVVLAVPLLVFSHVLRATSADAGSGGHLLTDVILGVGAGVYEEFIFRLVLISAVAMIGSDILGLPTRVTSVAAIVLSAVTFSMHHHPPLGGEPFTVEKFFFRAAAGAYLAILFVYRGYGPAAGTHAAYHVFVAIV